MLHVSSAESSHFHSAISNHLSMTISMSHEGMLAEKRFKCNIQNPSVHMTKLVVPWTSKE